MHPLVTPSTLTLPPLPAGTASIDVKFDGQRVWSIDVRDQAGGRIRLAWPEALRPYLVGATLLSVHDSASDAQLGASEVAFSDHASRVSVTDAAGDPLVINKWGRLGTALETMGAAAQRRILDRSATLISVLTELRLRPFVVGGTLLGGIRTGELLPHDDDADIAYLSVHTSPADVARESFRVGAQLAERGFEIRRHSATHLQLLFRDADGEILHYIDVFAAFFTEDGKINQPFHVRGEMRREQILPFRTVTIDGTEFPAPADPGHWLTINYDENWRTPIPGYVLETPPETRRRFDNWFGSFNLHREYWDEHFTSSNLATPAAAGPTAATRPAARAWELGASWIAEGQHGLSAPHLLDLGCGDGALARELASATPGRRVVGLDYCDEALATASRHETPEPVAGALAPRYSHANLYRLTAILAPRECGVTGAFDIVANHVLEQIGAQGREQAWRLIRMALRSGGNARFTFHAHHAADVRFEDPTGWHLDPRALEHEAASYGLGLEFTPLARPSGTVPGRRPTGATVSLLDPTATNLLHFRERS